MADTVLAVETETEESGPPWSVLIVLLVIFAVASFQPYLSVDYVTRMDDSVETRLEASIDRTEAGNNQRRAALLILGALSVGSLLRSARRPIQAYGVLPVLILFFLIWAWLSLLWSQDQALTFRRLVVLMMLCVGAFAAAERFSFRDITYFAFLAGATALTTGLAAEIVLGTFRPFDMTYRFAGTMNPIFQGALCGTLAISALALAHQRPRSRGIYVIWAFVALGFMLLTRSRGPAGATLAALAVYTYLMVPGLRKAVLVFGIPAMIVLLLSPMGQGLRDGLEGLLLFGRQVDSGYELQGRDALWAECLRYVSQAPFLGYGYDGFWTREFTMAVTDASGFTSQHTHNAILDLLLGVGVAGTMAFVLIVVVAAARLVGLHQRTHSPYHAAALCYVVLYVLHNQFVSAQLMVHLQTFVVMLVIARLAFWKSAPDGFLSDEPVERVRPPATH